MRSSLARSIGILPRRSRARTSPPRARTSLMRPRSLRRTASCRIVVPDESRSEKSQLAARGFAMKW